MEEIDIDFSAYYDKWVNSIEQGLKSRDIVFDNTLPLTICNSLRRTICKFLSDRGYRPIDNYVYRKNLTKRLKAQGLKLEIRSNRILWKYLEYFTDLDDYSLCFDIRICICDLDKAKQSNINITKTPLCYELSLDKFISKSEGYYIVLNEIDELKDLYNISNNNLDTVINKIITILQMLLDRLEELNNEKNRN